MTFITPQHTHTHIWQPTRIVSSQKNPTILHRKMTLRQWTTSVHVFVCLHTLRLTSKHFLFSWWLKLIIYFSLLRLHLAGGYGRTAGGSWLEAVFYSSPFLNIPLFSLNRSKNGIFEDFKLQPCFLHYKHSFHPKCLEEAAQWKALRARADDSFSGWGVV